MPVLLAAVVAIAVELYVLIEVAKAIGVAPAILALLLISASGPWLVRRAGFGVWRRSQERLAAGEVPGREALDGIVLLAGGLLLCIPGFVTDVFGLLLLIPPIRRLAGRVLAGRLARRAATLSANVVRSSPGGTTIRTRWGRGSEGPVLDVDSHPTDVDSHPTDVDSPAGSRRPPIQPGDPPPKP
ncbi:MAG: FxsA family protein [Actinomycetota bacterium]|nr:FxsA family protein [Actinomycetota bacterium]